MVVDLLRETIRQASEAPHIHPHREILAFHVAGADVLRVGIADDRYLFAARAFRRAVALLGFRIVAESLDKLRVVYIVREGVNNAFR